MVSILEEIKLSLGLYAFVKQNTRETYRDQGGVGAGWLVPLPGEGSCDAFLELSCNKDHFQCLVSITTLKCWDYQLMSIQTKLTVLPGAITGIGGAGWPDFSHTDCTFGFDDSVILVSNETNMALACMSFRALSSSIIFLVLSRSEERRVGKECRSRWSPYH